MSSRSPMDPRSPMDADDLRRRLHGAGDGVATRPAPGPDELAVAIGAERRRRRTRRAGVGAMAAAVVAVASLAVATGGAGLLADDAPDRIADRTNDDAPAPDDGPASAAPLPDPGEGMRWAGFEGVMVAVPEEWVTCVQDESRLQLEADERCAGLTRGGDPNGRAGLVMREISRADRRAGAVDGSEGRGFCVLPAINPLASSDPDAEESEVDDNCVAQRFIDEVSIEAYGIGSEPDDVVDTARRVPSAPTAEEPDAAEPDDVVVFELAGLEIDGESLDVGDVEWVIHEDSTASLRDDCGEIPLTFEVPDDQGTTSIETGQPEGSAALCAESEAVAEAMNGDFLPLGSDTGVEMQSTDGSATITWRQVP